MPKLNQQIREFDPQGFSLIELLTSVAIITILMAMLFQFIAANQTQYSTQQLQAEVSQGGRSAFEIMTQELNQAGYNPPFQQSRTLAAAANASGSAVIDVQLSGGGTSPITRGIFYGSRLVIGNTCITSGTPAVTTCDQEEVLVNADPKYSALSGGTLAIQNSTVPVVLANNHAAGEGVFSRNYPFPTGVYYDNQTAGLGLAVADNKIRFYGDVRNSGDLYYGEYRLQCPGGTAGTWIDACTPGCTTGTFTLTRFLTKLADPSTGIFKIPANKAGAFDGALASPLVDNIQGTCASLWTGGYTWPYNAPDETSSTGSTAVYQAVDYSTGTAVTIDPLLNPDGTPVIWFKMSTFGAVDTTVTPPAPYFQSFVTDLQLALTVQQRVAAAQGGAVRTQRLQTHIVPRNIQDALTIANGGGSLYLPQTPSDITTGYKLPLN